MTWRRSPSSCCKRSLSLRRAWIEMTTCEMTHMPRRSLSLRRAWIEIAWPCSRHTAGRSLSLRRAWIEISLRFQPDNKQRGRSPYGERGLKYATYLATPRRAGRSPYGERGLKCDENNDVAANYCRSPYGERGLKLFYGSNEYIARQSLSLRRAWIEITKSLEIK